MKTSAKVIIGVGIAIGLLVIIAVIGNNILKSPLDVKFFEKSLSESQVKEGKTTVLTVVARNNEDKNTVSNVSAKLSVVDGANADESLKFVESTKLADILSPGQPSETNHIQIQALKVSGTETKFKMKVELFVNDVKTDEYLFDITIVPNI